MVMLLLLRAQWASNNICKMDFKPRVANGLIMFSIVMPQYDFQASFKFVYVGTFIAELPFDAARQNDKSAHSILTKQQNMVVKVNIVCVVQRCIFSSFQRE